MIARPKPLWCGQIPNGRWAVFEAIDEDTHRIIAEFRDEGLARSYVSDRVPRREIVAQPALPAPEPMRRRNNDRKAEIQRIIETIVADLPRLFDAHPAGVPVSAIYDHGLEYQEALAVMRLLDTQGHGAWQYPAGECRRKALFPPGTPREIAQTQEEAPDDAIPDVWRRAVLNALTTRADDSGCSSMSTAVIAIAAHVPLGVIGAVLRALETSGEIMVARPRSGPRPATYQITRANGARAA